MVARVGLPLCPNGHRGGASIANQGMEVVCPVCGADFEPPSAESFAFNSYGACPACHGLGVRSEVDVSTLVPDPGKTIEEAAVLPWNSGGRRLSMYAAGQLGVQLDAPYKSLTDHQRDLPLHGRAAQAVARGRAPRHDPGPRRRIAGDRRAPADRTPLDGAGQRHRDALRAG